MTWRHHRGQSADPGARARESRAASGQRNPEVGLGLIREGARPSTAQSVKYIDEHRELYGVEPICEVLQVAPSTIYAAALRPPSARQLGDERLKVDIVRVHKENFNVYGAWKLWRQLNREGIPVGRDHVARLMPELGLVGTVRGKTWPTTWSEAVAMKRYFSRTWRRWVASVSSER